MRTSARAALLAVCLLASAATPAAPAATARQDEIVMLGNLAGEQKVSTGSDGVTRAEYSFNDRGRPVHRRLRPARLIWRTP